MNKNPNRETIQRRIIVIQQNYILLREGKHEKGGWAGDFSVHSLFLT